MQKFAQSVAFQWGLSVTWPHVLLRRAPETRKRCRAAGFVFSGEGIFEIPRPIPHLQVLLKDLKARLFWLLLLLLIPNLQKNLSRWPSGWAEARRAGTRSVLSMRLGTQRDVGETWRPVGNRLRLSMGRQGCV